MTNVRPLKSRMLLDKGSRRCATLRIGYGNPLDGEVVLNFVRIENRTIKSQKSCRYERMIIKINGTHLTMFIMLLYSGSSVFQRN